MKRASPEKYHSILLPSYPLGSKRRVFDTDYLSCLHRENMYLTDDTIVRVTPQGVVGKSGREYPADVIVLANGFQTQKFIQPVRIVNSTRGLSLDDSPDTGVWQAGPEAYLGSSPIPLPLFSVFPFNYFQDFGFGCDSLWDGCRRGLIDL
jgi:cation diffusion facilitator CzcD-associated flavoprotein CzcO